MSNKMIRSFTNFVSHHPVLHKGWNEQQSLFNYEVDISSHDFFRRRIDDLYSFFAGSDYINSTQKIRNQITSILHGNESVGEIRFFNKTSYTFRFIIHTQNSINDSDEKAVFLSL